MSTLNPTQLGKLRGENHKSQVFMTLAKPDTTWSAVITGTPSRGDRTITFNTGSGSNFGYVRAEMEVWVGSVAGSDDIGRLRVKSISSGDGGVTGTLTVALNALYFVAGNHLTFKLWFPLKPKYSRLYGDPENPTFAKDTDRTYTNENLHLYPVVIAGPNRSNFINTTWVINPHLEDSYTLDGSTITSYSATSLSLDGTPTISINAGTGVGTITFNAVGQYWIEYSITSDNGQTQKSYRFYYVHSTDPTSEHYPFIDFETKSIQGDWDKGGWSTGITVSDKAALDEIYDKTIAIIWAINYYQDSQENITFIPDNANTLISGYLQREKIAQDTDKNIGNVDFEIVTIQELLKERFMYSLSLESVQGTPNEWYKFSSLTIPKAVHHGMKWQSNLMEIADVNFGSNTIPRAFVELEAGSLYELFDGISYKFGIREHIVCDKSGRVFLTPDIQLLRDSERALLTTVQEIDTLDKSGKISVTRNPVKSVILTRVSGFAWDGTFTTNCAQPLTSPCPAVEALCSSAPTTQPEDEGVNLSSHDQQTFEDQTHANELAGRFHAQSNNLYPEFVINFSGNYSGVLDIHLPEFWTTNIASTDTVREFIWTDQNLIIRNITLQINQQNGTILPSVTFEPEVEGLPGVTTTCLGDWDFTFELPAFPDFNFPDLSTGGALITASDTNSVYYKGATNNQWVLRTSEDTLDLIQDPFWPIKTSSYEPGNSILLRCGVGFIKISDDTFVTDTDITPSSDPPNDAGDSPAPAVEDVEFFMIEGSYITQDYFVVGARWQNASNEWRSWVAITDDIGTTWSWESIISYVQTSPLISSTQWLFGTGGYLTFTPTPLTSTGGIGIVKLDDINEYYAAGSRQSTDSLRHGHLIERTATETLTEQSDVSGPSYTNRFGNSICRLTDTLFLTTNRIITPLTNLFVDRWTVSGTTVSYTGSLGTSQSPQPTNPKIARLDDTRAFLVWVAGSPGTAIYGAIINASTGTPSLGTIQTIYSGSGNITIHGFDYTATGEFIVFFSEGSDVKAILFVDTPFSTGSVSTIEVGGGGTISDGNTPIARINTVASPDIILIYTQSGTNIRGVVLNHTGTTINSISTPLTIATATNVTSIATALNSETEGAVFYYLSTGANGIISFTISGSAITPVSNNTGGFSLPGAQVNLLWTGEDRYFVAGWGSNSTNAGIATIIYPEITGGGGGWTPSTESNNKILGVSMGKGNGDKLYITMWQPNEIILQEYTLSTFTLDQQTTLATSVTETQLNNRAYSAFPYTEFGDDDVVRVFGRMDNGHLLYSDDGGATFSAEVDDWGADYCSSFFFDGYNKVALRSDGNNTKIYAGSGLTLRSTFPFPHVNPHNLKVNLFGGEAYILSGEAQSLMVISMAQPYLTYNDITANHTQVKDGFSLEIL